MSDKIPKCSLKRYKEMDKLMQELAEENRSSCSNSEDLGVKMMVDIWEIMKEDPDYDVEAVIRERLNTSVSCSSIKSCHCDCVEQMVEEDMKSIKTCLDSNSTREHIQAHIQLSSQENKCPCRKPKKKCPDKKQPKTIALIDTLESLKKMQSFDLKWSLQLESLMREEASLLEEVHLLETTEQNDINNLKKADEMWTLMEKEYKKKLTEAYEKQDLLKSQVAKIDKILSEMRKKQQEMEKQVSEIDETEGRLSAALESKTAEVKCCTVEIAAVKARIENVKKAIDFVKQKGKVFIDEELQNISIEAAKLEKEKAALLQQQKEAETKSKKQLTAIRNEMACNRKMIFELQAEAAAMRGEQASLQAEQDGLKQSMEQTEIMYKKKKTALEQEVNKLDKEMLKWKDKCSNCDEGNDTAGVLNRCSDCPRCWAKVSKEKPTAPSDEKCVCILAKEVLSENILENVFSVMKRDLRISSCEITEAIFNDMLRSKSGTMDNDVKNRLMEYFFKIIASSLDMSLQGGIAKTVCEMDPVELEELKQCLASNKKPLKLPDLFKDDKKKISTCPFWGGVCNCKKGACKCGKLNAKLKPLPKKRLDSEPDDNFVLPDACECLDPPKSQTPACQPYQPQCQPPAPPCQPAIPGGCYCSGQHKDSCNCCPDCSCDNKKDDDEECHCEENCKILIDNIINGCYPTKKVTARRETISKKDRTDELCTFEPYEYICPSEEQLVSVSCKEKRLSKSSTCDCRLPGIKPLPEGTKKVISTQSAATSFSGERCPCICPNKNNARSASVAPSVSDQGIYVRVDQSTMRQFYTDTRSHYVPAVEQKSAETVCSCAKRKRKTQFSPYTVERSEESPTNRHPKTIFKRNQQTSTKKWRPCKDNYPPVEQRHTPNTYAEQVSKCQYFRRNPTNYNVEPLDVTLPPRKTHFSKN